MKYALWLANIKGIGNQKIRYLRNCCESAEEIYYLKEETFDKIYGITPADKISILQSRKGWNLEQKIAELDEQNISFLSQEQQTFPKRLRTIIDAPYAIYYRGTLPKPDRKAVAIVGARGRSAYGSEMARELATELSRNGVDIISGMARGIDADGHMGALAAGGKTYAVLGCGVDVCYPVQNRYLYEQIPKRGALISEYPPKTAAKATLFPARNRIISAFCDCVIVVEARIKSGSLITTDYAMEQGRDVYAVPGRTKDSLSQGCNHLIRQGAGIVLSAEEFVRDWMMLGTPAPVQLDFKESLLEKDELQVYRYLDYNPTGIGTLIQKTTLNLPRILEVLERLTDKGFAKEVIPNYYVRKS